MTNDPQTPAKNNDFGDKRRVCDVCGIPLSKGRFPKGSKVCRECTPRHQQLAQAVITPEQQQQSYFDQQLATLRESSEPQVVNGIQKAINLLGESPQEIIAKCVKELMDPAGGNPDLTEEQRAAIPRDHKTLPKYLKLLQEAQIHHDKTLEGQKPYDGMSPEDLKATVLSASIDSAQSDKQLRRELIIAFITRCPSFVEEVNAVADDLLQAVQS